MVASSKKRISRPVGKVHHASFSDVQAELRLTSGKLLETAGTMQSFAQALNASQLHEIVDFMKRPWYSFWLNFVIGIARGLGFVIGATVVVALVVWIISGILSQVPFVGEFFQFLGSLMTPEGIKNIENQEFVQSINTLIDSLKSNVPQ